jgi:hypothetical protein
MIIEKDGKFYEKIEVEKEITEIEYLKRKVKALEERINLPVIQPSPIVICPCPCPKREEPVIRPWTQPGTSEPIWIYEPEPWRINCEVTLGGE